MLKLDHTTVFGQKLPFNKKKLFCLSLRTHTWFTAVYGIQSKANLTPTTCVAESSISLVSLAASSPVNYSARALHNIHVSYTFLISGLFYFGDFFRLEGWVRMQRDEWIYTFTVISGFFLSSAYSIGSVKINIYLSWKIMRRGGLHFAISAPRKTELQ